MRPRAAEVINVVRLFASAAVVLSFFALAPQITCAADGWYPFYGYHRPNYLAQPSVVFVQPSTAQVPSSTAEVRTTYYPAGPASVTAATTTTATTVVPQYSNPPRCGSGGWLPFYGNRRPNLQ